MRQHRPAAVLAARPRRLHLAARQNGPRLLAFVGDYFEIPTVGVAVDPTYITPNDPAVLALVRANRRALEPDEDITTGLLREALEETALEVEPLALTGVYKNMSRPIVALVFRCKATGGQLKLNDEVTAFRWATVDEVAEAVDEAFAVRVTDALSAPRVPAVRQHDGTHLL